MNRQDFAQMLIKVPSLGQTAALIIGLDGGSALLGHSAPEKMFAELLSVPEDQSGKFNVNRLRSAWAALDLSRKRDLLKRHTTANAVDRYAVAFLAELLRGGYLRTIVATDPNRHLFELLRKAGVALDEPLSCSTMTPNVIRGVSAAPDHKVVLIDAGEMLIQGAALAPIYMSDPGEMSSAIRDTALRFGRSFVWGWHDRFNVGFYSIWPAKDIYALGAYTNLADLPYNYQQVEDPEDDERPRATTKIFADLQRRLFPHGLSVALPNLDARNSPATGTPLESVFLPGASPALLWRDEDLSYLFSQLEKTHLLLAAVDGSLVRSRLAARIAEHLRAKGERCWQSSSVNETLLNEIALAQASSIDQFSIVTVDGWVDDAPPRWQMIVALERWLEKTKKSNRQLILIAPAALIHDLQAWPKLALDPLESAEVQVLVLLGSACTEPAFIQRWLEGLPLLETLHGAERRDLAGQMYDALQEISYASADAAVDRIHCLLDFWYMELRDHQEKGGDAEEPSKAWCLATWQALLACLDDIMDFDLGAPRPRPLAPAGGDIPGLQDDDLDDFDLQLKKTRKKDEHE